MVFKTKKKSVPEPADIEYEEQIEEKPEEKYVQVPVILTEADVTKLVYENNLILRELISYVRDEQK